MSAPRSSRVATASLSPFEAASDNARPSSDLSAADNIRWGAGTVAASLRGTWAGAGAARKTANAVADTDARAEGPLLAPTPLAAPKLETGGEAPELHIGRGGAICCCADAMLPAPELETGGGRAVMRCCCQSKDPDDAGGGSTSTLQYAPQAGRPVLSKASSGLGETVSASSCCCCSCCSITLSGYVI
jgi:hypothetical protein